MAENDSLSKRELEILQKVATGATNQQVAVDLDISINTVKAHLRNIYGKLEAESRTEAVMMALQQGLIAMETDESAEPTVSGDTESSDLVAPKTPVLPKRWWQYGGLFVAVLILIVAGIYALTSRPEATQDPFGDHPPLSVTGEPAQEHARWELFATLPQGRARFASAGVGNLVIVAGGTTNDGITNSTIGFDSHTGTWQELASKPSPATNIQAASLGDQIYIPGGLDNQNRVLSNLEIYDPEDDSWSTGQNLPKPRCAYALTTQDGLLYLFGGWDGSDYSQDVYCYNSQDDIWRIVGQCPVALGFSAATSDGTLMYLTGGFDGEQELASCWAFDPLAKENAAWQELPPMEMARRGHAAVFSDDRLFVVGGGWSNYLLYNEYYDPTTNGWSRFESPIIGMWHNLGVVPVKKPDGSHILAIGGWDGTYLNTVETYQTSFRVYLPGS